VSFLRFAVERVKAFLHHTTEAETAENDNSAQKLLAELRGLLKQQIGANRVIFILDGLDEIAEREPMFASEVPLAIALPGVVWLCAGRSERGLEKAFAGDSVIPIFAEGVPPMDENEVRSMLLEKIGPLRKRLVANDFETGEKVSNAFVTKVTTCAQGLPLYVSYVIGDILLNRLRVLDAGERLAPSLDAYHRELLHRCSVGILQQVMTPLVATIAVAKEPLSAQALADLLVRDNRIPDDNEALPRVRQSLGAVVSIVRRATTPDGEQRFTIYHHSIRQHMEASTEMAPALSTARRNLSTLALSPSSGSASLYLYRHGIAHLLESGKREDALNLLTNFDYLMSRLRALPGADGISGLLADWLSASTGILSDEQRIWAAFVRERANILRRGDDIWPSFKILLQQAVEHAGASPVTLAAESWIAEGHCDWIWLRNAQRVELVPIQPCIATFEGHTEAVTGALILPDDNVLSWSEDKTLRVWDGKSFCCRTTLVGHDGGVRGALLLPADRVLSWANDRSPRIWNYQSGECQAVLSGHTRATRGALLLPDGNLVTWAEDHALRVWDAVTGACLATLEGHADWIRGALILDNDTLVSWSDDKTLRIWDTKNYVCHRTFVGHTGWVWGALVLSGAELLSWSRDGSMRRWDISSGECRTTFQGHEKWVRGAIVLDHESCLSWSDDNSLRTWDLHSGKCRHVMEGHVSEVTGALVLEDGDILSWSTPNADSILRIWDVASGTCKKILDHHRQPVEQAMQLDDGRILSWSADKSLRLWDSSAGILARSLEGHEWPVSGVIVLSRDRVLSWSRDSTLRVWDIAIGASSSNLEGHRGGILQLRSMPDGSILSWSSDPYGSDNLLRIWDVESGSCRTSLDGHSKYIAGVLVLRDARVLSWSWLDEPMRISSAASVACRTMGTGSDGRTLGALELPDGTVASWADDQTVRIWDVDLGECRLTLQGHTSVADGVLSLPSGDLLSWSAEERALRIWDMSTGECRLTLNGHTDRVWDAGILPDGSILSRSADSTIRVWDASNGICTHVIDETVAEVERPDLAAAAWSDAPWFATRPRELDSRHPRACSLSNKGGVFAEWHATGACRGSEALASGTAVATLDEGHVYFLKLYAGAERVTLEEAERILTSAVVPT
jgi:WD40 repeat protein